MLKKNVSKPLTVIVRCVSKNLNSYEAQKTLCNASVWDGTFAMCVCVYFHAGRKECVGYGSRQDVLPRD